MGEHNGLYDRLDQASAKLIMLRDSCDRIAAHNDLYPRFAWYEGTAAICQDVIGLMEEILLNASVAITEKKALKPK
ncbi:MAG: hypothetical protein HWN68_01140 [Desulfobacterales bacterium]|nr:hypothetical protein [Desulfobacterales bacterium]